jgi:hypothetical protein
VLGWKDFDQFSDSYSHILAVMKNFSQGKRNIAGVQSGGCYLVKEWLKLVIVEPIQ